MGVLDTLQDDITGFATEHRIATAAGVGAVGVGAGVALGAAIGSRTKKKARKSKFKRRRARDSRFKSKQKHERRYKRKRKYKIYGRKGWIHPKRKHHNSKRLGSKRGIRYTKKGQPYKIMSDGKAKFIKKSKRRRR